MSTRGLTGPEFGSYAREEVTWLLTDLSSIALEAPTREREEAIQSGRSHYAESLPIEYQPSDDYRTLFADALQRSADRVARAVGLVSELVLATRGPAPVFASLARAGTPIGILMQHWARSTTGVTPPHYSLSIVRGRGIDQVALAHLAERHDPATVVFVDGWTGKGAIARELRDSLEKANTVLGTQFSPELAVLADPGCCVRLFGTRDDFLIPSACLNSTVSGLVSRTVLNDSLIGPGDFHGAKFYSELADSDESRQFIDTVVARFPAVLAAVRAELGAHCASDRTPRWTGWSVVERIGADHGITDLNLIKPGVGETTRVLLRRVPWKILVRPDALPELAHVVLLARHRGVEVVEVDDLGFSCVGLIAPQSGNGSARR